MLLATGKEDALSHIDYEEKIDADDPESLRNRVASVDGRIVIVSAFGCSLVLYYSFNITSISIQVKLETPVGSKTIVDVELNPSNPSITLGGSLNSFKAEVTVAFDFGTMVLSATGEICAPFVGCKKGSISLHV